MDIDREALRKHYEILSDEDIERLAYYEAKDLSPEAVEILRNEIKNRGLSDSFDEAVETHVAGLEEEEKSELLNRISDFPCPLCDDNQAPLNASKVVIVKSFIVFTTVDKPLIIGCPECIKANAKKALITSSLLGWWGIPWGPIRTLWSLVDNIMALSSKRYHEPTYEFLEFFAPHLIAIKVKIDEAKDLDGLLESINYT